MANKTKVAAKKTTVVSKKTTVAAKNGKTVAKKPVIAAKKKPIAVKKAVVVAKKKPIAVKKAVVVAKKKPIAVKKAVIVAKKKPIAVKKAIVVAKKKPVAVKKAVVVAKKKPIEVKKAVVVAKKKPIEVKKAVVATKAKPIEVEEAEVAVRRRPAAFSKPIGSAKKRKSRAKKALIPNKQETGDEEQNKRTPWNKKPAVKKKRLIIEKPTLRAQPDSNEPKKVHLGPKKIKYQVEMDIHASPRILYPYLSTSSGLSEWFALKVDDRNDVYTFEWEGSVQVAMLVSAVENESVRFHWIDDPDETYFEIELIQDEMTSDVAIIITDFCLPGEKEENTLLWESQIHDLMHIVGSQF